MQLSEPSHLETTSCVCAAADKPHKKRKISQVHSIIAHTAASRDNRRCDFGCWQFHCLSRGVKLPIVARPNFSSSKGEVGSSPWWGQEGSTQHTPGTAVDEAVDRTSLMDSSPEGMRSRVQY